MASIQPVAQNPSSDSNHVYASGILFSTFSFITMLLILPPMFWHFRNRNIGATSLIAWLVILLFFNFINPIIWPTDNWHTWYNGAGLCDVEVKIQVAASVALPASFACILRALAAVMDVEKTKLVQTKAERRRNLAIDLLWCLGFPLLEMLFHYVVQPFRYYIWSISGCGAVVDSSLLSIFLIIVPPAVWFVINAYYATLIIIRLYRYRINFRTILVSRNTTKSRFLRLYIVCLLWMFCSIPIEVYIITINAKEPLTPFSWSATHNAEAWRKIVYMASHGRILYDRFLALGFGVLVFIFFGFGKDAVGMYKASLTAMGLGKCVGRMDLGCAKIARAAANPFGDTTKSLMSWKQRFSASSGSETSRSQTSSTTTDSVLLKDEACHLKVTRTSGPRTLEEVEALHQRSKPGVLTRLFSSLQAWRTPSASQGPNIELESHTGETAVVRSTVSVGSAGCYSLDEDGKVLVSKEIRKGSEAA